jgi:hypothetical protein
VKQFILGSRIDAVWGLKIWMAVRFATMYSGFGEFARQYLWTNASDRLEDCGRSHNPLKGMKETVSGILVH